MRATLTSSSFCVTIELTQGELIDIVQGIGNTSEGSRMKAGMTEQQSKAVCRLYYALSGIANNEELLTEAAARAEV